MNGAAIQTLGEGGGRDQRGENGSGDNESAEVVGFAIELARRADPGRRCWLILCWMQSALIRPPYR